MLQCQNIIQSTANCFMCCRALCLLYCSDVLRDSHSKVCTRCPQNLANPGDEECSCDGQLITSALGLWLVAAAAVSVQQCPQSSACLQPPVPRAGCAMAPRPRNCHQLVLLMGMLQGALSGLRALSKALRTGGLSLASVTYK